MTDGSTGETITVHDFRAFWLHRLSAQVLQRFEKALAEFGVTAAQWNILLVIERGQADSPRAIAECVGVDAGSVSRALDRLAAKNLIERIHDQQDGRSVRVALTLAGRQIMAPTVETAISQDIDWLAELTASERRAFLGTMSRLLQAQGTGPIELPVDL